jgi:potassium-transporting ATPase potassium-binding subunit
MNALDISQVLLFFLLLIILTPVLGSYMHKVFSGERHFMFPVFGWLEKLTFGVTGTKPEQGMGWKTYTWSLLLFNLGGFVVLFLLQLTQNLLPLNPACLPAVSWHLALNTAMSFITNTNWQSYAGETTISYLVQMVGLTVQNFLSAATGIAVMLALVSGIVGRSSLLGNFWADITRIILYVLLPLSVIFAVVLNAEGVIQNFSGPVTVSTLEGGKQVITMGPVASQEAIKQLGTNGGGYFNANSAHPFENPTPLTNFLEMLAVLLIPAALTYTYGKMSGSLKQGYTLFTCMMVLFVAGLLVSLYAEYHMVSPAGKGLVMEGKELRFGTTGTILWTVVTTVASNGSVNGMIDSMSPLTGMTAMFNIMLGEVIFGGVGSGMYGMLLFVFLTVFIAGLMVGRTPEYLGKKIEAFEVRMALAGVLIPGFMILLFSAIASVSKPGLAGLNNAGSHGLSEILYAFSSAAGNNGSAFAGLNANTVFYNLTLSLAMLAGRFGVIIPVMAIAGSMAVKKVTPLSVGTFRTDNLLFIILLTGVILIVGGLTFFPALSLGPLAEHILMHSAVTF